MPTKPLDRLMFAQGEQCFFCRAPLPRSEASVEHLVASANGGSNNDENCVACCKSVNALFGRMSLKEKIQIILNQKGSFKCPNGFASNMAETNAKSALESVKTGVSATAGNAKPKPQSKAKSKVERLAFVVDNLKQRGNSRPRTLKTLSSTVASLFNPKLAQSDVAALVQQLQTSGKVRNNDGKVSYTL